MSTSMLRSLSRTTASITSIGRPYLSFLLRSSRAWFSWYGRISPNAVMLMFHGPGSCTACLSSAPISALSLKRPTAGARCAALVAEAAQVVALVLADVAIARNVEAIGAPAGVGNVEIAFDRGVRATGLVVIHDVVAELARIVAEAVRKAARNRIHHDERRADRRGAQEDHLGEVVGLRAGFGIEHAHAGGACPCRCRRSVRRRSCSAAASCCRCVRPTAASPRRC